MDGCIAPPRITSICPNPTQPNPSQPDPRTHTPHTCHTHITHKQASPVLYTTEPSATNTTIAFVAQDGPILDEWAVVAALKPLGPGAVLGASAPFLAGPARGGGGSTTQLLEQFGVLAPARTGGNAADLIDLQPDIVSGAGAAAWRSGVEELGPVGVGASLVGQQSTVTETQEWK